jgi:hypothetical protein
MSQGTSFIDGIKQDRDKQFYIVYTVLYAFIILLTDIVNGVVGGNYGWYDVTFYWEHARDIMNGAVPYVDFDTAYPPFSFVTYLIPYFFTPSETGFHYGFAIFTYLLTLPAIHGLLGYSDRHNLDHKYVYITFLLLILGLNNFYIARNDTITTMFVILCIILFSYEKYAPAFILLALGIMTKIYPVFLLPILLVPFLANRDWKGLFKYGALTVAVCLIIELPFIISDPSTAFSYLTQHSGRGVEIESVVAIPLMIVSLIDPSLVYVGMDESWDLFGPWAEAVSPYIMPMTFGIMLLFLIYFVIRMVRIRPDREKSMALTVMACAVMLMLFMTFNKVFCAQYVMWVVILFPMLIHSFNVFGIDHKRLLYYLVFLSAASLLTVLAMADSTETVKLHYVLADILKAIAAIVLTVYLLKALKKGLDRSSSGENVPEPSNRGHMER